MIAKESGNSTHLIETFRNAGHMTCSEGFQNVESTIAVILE